MSAHTPGPWWKSYDLGTYEIRADGGVVVAKDCTKEDADAIASMPDLLEALEGVIDDLYDWCDEEGDSEYNKRVQKCKDAIIKATTIHMV